MTIHRGAGKLFLSVCAALLAAQPEIQAQGGREEHDGNCSRHSGFRQARGERETLIARAIGDNVPKY